MYFKKSLTYPFKSCSSCSAKRLASCWPKESRPGGCDMGVGKSSEKTGQNWTQPGVKERMSWERERKMRPMTRDDWKVKEIAWE